ncbi:MAG: DUF72 domain-containing protein [Gemmatimonadota bacterium]
MAETRVGISGWTYPGWRGIFYPEGLAHRRELEYASRRMRSVEINGSFYSLQTPSSYARWRDETPPRFVFAVKGGRFITHMKKLNGVEEPLANFFASGVLRLGPKLEPILWQFPQQLGFLEERFERFLELLPRTTEEAAELAKRHGPKLEGRAWTRADAARPLRHAFELRHPAFFAPEFVRLLRRHNAALVFADTAQRWPYAEDLTADFVYVRLHGAEQLYASGYTDAQLDWWAERDVYVYFDNDAKVRAPFDALRLAERLGG